jgi:hypothetical protein
VQQTNCIAITRMLLQKTRMTGQIEEEPMSYNERLARGRISFLLSFLYSDTTSPSHTLYHCLSSFFFSVAVFSFVLLFYASTHTRLYHLVINV